MSLQYQWTTTNWVIWETVSWLRRRVAHAATVGFRERIQASRLVEVIIISAGYETRAWETFKRYHDKDFGFIDCTSFAVMEALKISAASTFDDHLQTGFSVLPDLHTTLHQVRQVRLEYEASQADQRGIQP